MNLCLKFNCYSSEKLSGEKMLPKYHIVISAIISLLFYFTSNSVYGAFLVFLFGSLLDLDHLLDFWILNKRISFDIEISDRFYMYKKVYVILHAYELIPFVLILGFFISGWIGLGIIIGYLSHLATDVIWNYLFRPLKPIFYSFFYRYTKNFNHFTLCPDKYK